MQCPRCRHENPARAKFCLECGQRLPSSCGACGTELPDTARFCPECGRPVGAGAAAPSEPAPPEIRTPATYTPRHLAERILTSRSALEGERKPVTVLFCDLVGSTALAERLGRGGDARRSSTPSSRPPSPRCIATRAPSTSSSATASWRSSAPRSPTRTTRAAPRSPRSASPGRSATGRSPSRPEAEITLTVRMGLHTGFVVVGAIGDNLRMDYTAVGDTTHLAARLQQLAEPGAILASEATWRLVEGYIDGQRVGPVSVKGRSEPVVVFRLARRRVAPLAPGGRRAARPESLRRTRPRARDAARPVRRRRGRPRPGGRDRRRARGREVPAPARVPPASGGTPPSPTSRAGVSPTGRPSRTCPWRTSSAPTAGSRRRPPRGDGREASLRPARDRRGPRRRARPTSFTCSGARTRAASSRRSGPRSSRHGPSRPSGRCSCAGAGSGRSSSRSRISTGSTGRPRSTSRSSPTACSARRSS